MTSSIIKYYYHFCYYTVITSLLLIMTSLIITYYYCICYYTVVTSLLGIITFSLLPIIMTSLLYIITSLLPLLLHYSQLQKQVIMGSLLHIHIFIITSLLPIITIITHYYMLPTGQLADVKTNS